MPLHPLLAEAFRSASIDPHTLPPASGNIIRTSTAAYFAKTGSGPTVAQMRGEAASLRAMAASAPAGLVPAVIGYAESEGEAGMVSAYAEGTRGPAFQRRLGEALAAMHCPGESQQYGFELPTHCGATAQDNAWNGSWEAFFRDQRLGALVAQIRDARVSALWEELKAGALPLLLRDFRPPPQPVILHGDLWSGNVAAGAKGEPVIFDPASYYGHGEADLGITRMFGGFTPAFYDAYHAARPRSAPHYERRQELYELYHHLNHALMFGGGYVASAVRIMRGLVAWAEGVRAEGEARG
ncbi:fructosamine 3 kinase [Vanrija albida]|uniref:protein-ribulosamine 3-kinase n=1 Tax=Vanrija albida TaxID=181172 RepID=A0ABR3Q402_9TREE